MLSISESPPAENTIAVEQDSGPDNWVPGPLTHHSHLEEVVPTLKNVPGNELEFRSNFRQNYSDAQMLCLRRVIQNNASPIPMAAKPRATAQRMFAPVLAKSPEVVSS